MPNADKIASSVDRLAEFFTNQRDGQFIVDFADRLEEITRAVQQHRKGGKLVVSISLSPLKKTADALSIRDTIKATVPEAEQPESLFFANDDGELGIEHPSQRRIPGVERRPRASDVGIDPTTDLRQAAAQATADLRAQGHDVEVTVGPPASADPDLPPGAVVDHGDDEPERPRVVGE
ncbi:MAG: hypothetical protein PGN13_16225 [Patulibacter minatonensis]